MIKFGSDLYILVEEVNKTEIKLTRSTRHLGLIANVYEEIIGIFKGGILTEDKVIYHNKLSRMAFNNGYNGIIMKNINTGNKYFIKYENFRSYGFEIFDDSLDELGKCEKIKFYNELK